MPPLASHSVTYSTAAGFTAFRLNAYLANQSLKVIASREVTLIRPSRSTGTSTVFVVIIPRTLAAGISVRIFRKPGPVVRICFCLRAAFSVVISSRTMMLDQLDQRLVVALPRRLPLAQDHDIVRRARTMPVFGIAIGSRRTDRIERGRSLYWVL